MPLIPTSPRRHSPVTSNGGLPPIPLGQHARRLTNIRRSNTTNIDRLSSQIIPENYPTTFFQTRPLKNVQVIPRNVIGERLNGISEKPNGYNNGRQGTLIRQNISDNKRHLGFDRRASLERRDNILDTRRSSFNGKPFLLNREQSLSHSLSTVSNISRSISPCSSYSIRSTKSPTPRRIYPQVSTPVDLSDLEQKEQSPVVFDANLTFVIGCPKTSVRQNIKPTAAHLDDATASNLLSAKISDFLKRTDHVMDEWKSLGHKDDDSENLSGYYNIRRNAEERRVLGRSRSATNIMIKGFQYFSRASSVSRSNSVMRDFSDDRLTDFDQMTELDEVCDNVYVCIFVYLYSF